MFGISTAVDSFVQHAVSLVLIPLHETEFIDNSFDLRPHSGAHDPSRVLEYAYQGYRC